MVKIVADESLFFFFLKLIVAVGYKKVWGIPVGAQQK